MSNEEVEVRREGHQTESVARALGMRVEELEGQDWSIEPDVGKDDMIYGYVVSLENGQKAYITLPDAF